ncbi:hypothetical protein KIW84_046063 [Lathyrus oleraceus]|uniref:Uncharacterized protein n=1 Tax=Pisum sativum TaxID=3888 RepID=A0A9D4XM88_PEA|nr:hypothetical protein KIW84_046063 [Pisum sativum]
MEIKDFRDAINYSRTNCRKQPLITCIVTLLVQQIAISALVAIVLHISSFLFPAQSFTDFAINSANPYYLHPNENPTLVLVSSVEHVSAPKVLELSAEAIRPTWFSKILMLTP